MPNVLQVNFAEIEFLGTEPNFRRRDSVDWEQSLFFRLVREVHALVPVVICVSRAFCSMNQEKRETARSLWLQKIAINIWRMGDLNGRYVSFVYQAGGVMKKKICWEVGLKVKHLYADEMRWLTSDISKRLGACF